MNQVCGSSIPHVMFQKQYDLEHFKFVIARCQRCDEFLECKAFPRENKKDII